MASSALTTIQTQLTLYAYPILMSFGTMGNIFIIILFSRQRQNACSLYLLTSAILNILYLLLNGFVQIFPIYYGDSTLRATILCKVYTYEVNIVGQAAKIILVLACIDRFMITHHRVNFRTLSTPRKAKYLIFFSITLWPLISIHVPFMTTIVNRQCIRVGIYATIFTIYTILVVGLIPSFTMGVFGCLTYHNIRQLHNRIQPAGQDTNHANISIRRRDRDLLVLVISEVLVYVITTSLFPLINLEMMISRYVILNKSLQYVQTEVFIFNIAYLLLFINSSATFYTYLIASKSFRRDFKQLCINSHRMLRRQPSVQMARRVDNILPQQDTRV